MRTIELGGHQASLCNPSKKIFMSLFNIERRNALVKVQYCVRRCPLLNGIAQVMFIVSSEEGKGYMKYHIEIRALRFKNIELAENKEIGYMLSKTSDDTVKPHSI